ncbi:MAG: cysteine desulfurase [Clostridia bacterium]|nr:cysteine desulfurase [Clostridia bacterium]MBR2968819.1 cysteine desulfurase [Clostridia bacterium]
MNRIYFDHAATTPLDKRVLEKMTPYFCEMAGNANSQHYFGREAMKAVDEARDKIATLIGAKPSEIYFTSGGTEADNWALRGAAAAYGKKGKHFIISKIEHAAMLSTAADLEKQGFEFTYLDVDERGMISTKQLEKSIRPDTVFIGIMFANNEVGTIQPIQKAAEIAKKHGIPFFTDAVQAMGTLEINVKELGIDMMSFSAHKFYGPKGIGALYVRNGLTLGRLITGGHQERTKRGGTTNVPGVVGFAAALEIACAEMEENRKYVTRLRDKFISRVEKEIPYVKLNGHRTKRLPANADFSFEYIEGESILFSLDLAGIAVSSGSACSSGSLEPSHVLLAMGVDEALAHGSIRFTFGKHNTMDEVNYTVDKLKETVARLRKMSPLFAELKGEIKNV